MAREDEELQELLKRFEELIRKEEKKKLQKGQAGKDKDKEEQSKKDSGKVYKTNQ